MPGTRYQIVIKAAEASAHEQPLSDPSLERTLKLIAIDTSPKQDHNTARGERGHHNHIAINAWPKQNHNPATGKRGCHNNSGTNLLFEACSVAEGGPPDSTQHPVTLFPWLVGENLAPTTPANYCQHVLVFRVLAHLLACSEKICQVHFQDIGWQLRKHINAGERRKTVS